MIDDRNLSDELKMLMDDIRKKNREVLERHLFELVAAYNIGKETASVLDVEKCIEILGNRIADLMSVQIVSVMLMDKDKGELIIKLAKGLNKEIIREAKIKAGEGIAGWIAKTGEALLIEDITKDPRFAKRDGKYNTNSLLSVPLKVRDKVIGVINVNNKVSKDIFRQDDLVILKTVADMAAVAIENARLQEETRALEKMKSDFVANISHELRSPLSVIKEAVRVILDGIAGKINDKQKEFLMMAKYNADRLARLINELLELARLESKKTPMKRKRFNITEVVKKAADSFMPLVRRNGITLTAHIPKGKIDIWADEDKIAQVITNLIDNSLKYNKPKGRIDVYLEDIIKHVVIRVSDTGIGIPPEYLNNIFDRFRRLEGAKDEMKGAGLGLAIVKEIINMHGGKISADSKLGSGSEFIVRLPKGLRSEELIKGA